MWNEILHDECPRARHVSDGRFQLCLQVHDILHGQLVEDATPRPLSGVLGHFLGAQEQRDCHGNEERHEEADEATPICDANVKSEPQSGSDDDGTEMGEHVRVHDRSTEAFNLLFDTEHPSSTEGFPESDQQQDEVDVPIDGIQEEQSGIGGYYFDKLE